MGITDRLFNMKNEKASANLKAGQDFLEANKQSLVLRHCQAACNTK